MPAVAIGAICAVHLWILRPELTDVTTRSDLTVHRTMIDWATGRLQDGKFPIDGWFGRIGLGFPMMHQYQTLPHQIAALGATVIGVGNASRWSTFLIVGTWPIAMYLGCRLLGLSVGTAIVAAGLAPLVASNPSYGFEHSSYIWRGLGLWTQMWAMWMFPIAMGLAWRAVNQRRNIASAAAATAFVFCTHLQTGYLLAMIIGAMAFVSFVDFRGRVLRMMVVLGGSLIVSAWLLVPVFTDQRWSANTEFNANTVWVDSFGASKVWGWLVGGELFDRDHPPVLTVLVFAGVVVAAINSRKDPLSRLVLGTFVVSFILFCGKDPFGPVIGLLPGVDSLLLHRFISGVQFSGVLLAAMAVVTGARWLHSGLERSALARVPTLTAADRSSFRLAFELSLGALLLVALVPAINVTDSHERQAAGWMKTQRVADRNDGEQIDALVATALADGGGRIYAGLLGNRGGGYLVGGSRAQTVIQEAGPTDVLGYSLRIPSLLADVEVRFNQNNPAHYEMFNVRWVVQPADRAAPPNGQLFETQGQHNLFQIQNATGYIGVVDVEGSYPAERDNVGRGAEAVLASTEASADRPFPVVEYEDLEPVAATVVPGVGGAPGTATDEADDLDGGRFGANVSMAREGFVILRAAYHQRMSARVDGVSMPTSMVAPGFVGVRVPAGDHRVDFVYEPYPHYPVLIAAGFVAVVGLWFWGRRRGPVSLPVAVPSVDHLIDERAVTIDDDRFAGDAQVLEVGEGLAFGHVAPGSFSEQSPHVVGDGSLGQVVGSVADDVEPLVVVFEDVIGPTGQVLEGMPVGRQDEVDFELVHERERFEEPGEGIDDDSAG